MIVSRRTTTTTGVDSLAAGPSPPPPPSRIPSTRDARLPKDKGKGKAVARKPWADGPWPLIETPSRTQRRFSSLLFSSSSPHRPNQQEQITHPALHVANELARTHNAMLRGLNALYLQAPFVRLRADVADFLFVARVWSGWVLDYHGLKETVMMPGFEAALGLEPGSLGLALRSLVFGDGGRGGIEEEDEGEKEEDGEGEDEGGKGVKDLPTLLRSVHSYAIDTTHSQPSTYSPSILQALLASLASVLVPHLHAQIPLMMQLKELCSPPSLSSSSYSSFSSSPQPSSPVPNSNSNSSTTASSLSSSKSKSKPKSTTTTTTTTTTASADRAARLTQIYLSAETSFSSKADRFTIPPLFVRLRDAAHDGASGGLSVPAVHAIADRLSPRHAGAWRFLPCDVWGRRRELEFLGELGG
ncbi:hypothetical protein F4776DRAFT_675713 [Hypoxylon sp. NC0597]|nr:hypothetical protein F4776DRAFT_675713 [Hypoxylon sp. NC0597]